MDVPKRRIGPLDSRLPVRLRLRRRSRPVGTSIAINRPDPYPNRGRVTVVVADRQAPILRGVCDFLEGRGIDVVGRAHDGPRALELIRELRPSVALLDPNLPELDGIEIAATVRRILPRTAVIIYSDIRYRELLVDAIEAGARGFVPKDAPLRDLVRAIEMVCDGRYYVNVRLLDLLSDSPKIRRTSELTQRQADVLAMPETLIDAGALRLSQMKTKARVDAPMTPQLILQLCLLSLIMTPFFLPKMHNRFFYTADVLAIAYAFYYPRRYYVAVAVSFASFFAYQPFLFKKNMLPLPLLSLVMLVALVSVARAALAALDENEPAGAGAREAQAASA